MKKFISLFPKELIESCEKEMRDNPPVITLEKNDPHVQFLLQKYVDMWWKDGGYKIDL